MYQLVLSLHEPAGEDRANCSCCARVHARSAGLVVQFDMIRKLQRQDSDAEDVPGDYEGQSSQSLF